MARTVSDNRPQLLRDFQAFHAAHPELYATLVALARRDRDAGRRASIRRIWEEARGTLGVRVNDHFHALYAREIMRRERDLAGRRSN